MLNFRVDNKLAIVTGCSKGIGMAIAIELANSGADIIGVSGSMPAAGSDVEKAVLAAGKNSTPTKQILRIEIRCMPFYKK